MLQLIEIQFKTWERQSQVKSTDPLSVFKQWALALELLLTKRWRVHTASAGLVAVCGNIFSCFLVNSCHFVLLKHVCQWTLGRPPSCNISNPRRSEWLGAFCWDTRVVDRGQLDSVSSQGHLLAVRDLHTPGGWSGSGSSLCEYKPCSIQCLSVVFSLVTQIPRCSGQRYLGWFLLALTVMVFTLLHALLPWSPSLALVMGIGCTAQPETLQWYLKGTRGAPNNRADNLFIHKNLAG